jgi:hypothetical protein
MIDRLQRNRRARSDDPRAEAALQFVPALAARIGAVSDDALRDMPRGGHRRGRAVQLIGLVALNVFTNYFNRLVRPAIDFPIAEVSGQQRTTE